MVTIARVFGDEGTIPHPSTLMIACPNVGEEGKGLAMSQVTDQDGPKQPLEDPKLGPKKPSTSCRVDEPVDMREKGSEPDYFPGKPGGDLPKQRQSLRERRADGRRPRVRVSWLQAH
jgi:hypothetical protein